jgi:hypothetical protein
VEVTVDAAPIVAEVLVIVAEDLENAVEQAMEAEAAAAVDQLLRCQFDKDLPKPAVIGAVEAVEGTPLEDEGTSEVEEEMAEVGVAATPEFTGE